MNDIEKIIKQFENLGLSLNPAKCEIFFSKSVTNIRKREILEKRNHLLPGIKVITKENFTLLGALISDEAVVLTSKYNILQLYLFANV